MTRKVPLATAEDLSRLYLNQLPVMAAMIFAATDVTVKQAAAQAIDILDAVLDDLIKVGVISEG
jgi:hypothetical protein